MKTSNALVLGLAVAANAASRASNPKAKPHVARQATLPTVTVRGNAFWAGDERFYIRGVDYQPGGSSEAIDPIANTESCLRDVEYFQELGINTIRVYTVDNSPDTDHDECMNALAEAGIYLALDVNTPLYSLNRDDPAGSYNDVYLQSVFATMDKFAGYSNTLLFFSGNEVINAANNSNCAPYVKATTRDMKSYIASQGLRKIPVGYSAADVEESRFEMASYMNCGSEDQRSDFFAFNDYSWCSPSSYTESGWNQKVQQYSRYSIPLFLSEYGCITNERDFSEVAALYGSQMTPVYSGGLVYEYSEEDSGYGLVRIEGDDDVEEKDDFDALEEALENNPPPSGDGGYKENLPPSQCPSPSNTWEVRDFQGANLPSIPDGAVQYLKDGAGDGPGLDGDGSQWATDGASDSVAQPGSGTGTSASGAASSSSAAEANAASALGVDVTIVRSALVCAVVVLLRAVY